ncbi:MAG: replicative DNA helicase [Synergistaceae bacterium]|nr:replicative DNA helicase [Synergistaceae bacterium]
MRIEFDLSIPNNQEAERAVLGACLVSKEALESVLETLKTEDFYDVYGRKLFEVMSAMYSAGKPVDFVTIQTELTARGIFSEMGGQPFLAQLAANVTTTSNVLYHAEIVKETALRRRLIEGGREIAETAVRFELDSAGMVSEAEKIILKASQNLATSQITSAKELSASVMRAIENICKTGDPKFSGYSSGFSDLDRIIMGFQPGSLNVIAARPSMGKTALALNIAQFGGEQEKNPCALIFSLEMSSEQLMMRMLSAKSEVKISDMTTGTLSEDEIISLKETAEFMRERNIYILDSSELSAIDFRTKCRRFKTRHPELELIVVDYLQLMHADRKRSDNRQQETADISRMLKAVAVELECPVIALSQLSREVERRVEKKPQLSDLRDSGAIEQDADTVILLYREDYYDEERLYPSLDSKAELRVAKNRNGRTGVCSLTFQREYTRFVNYAKD